MSSTVGTADSFVHLHTHTEYSMLDGAAKIGGLMGRAAELQMPAIAITDHGNVHGAYDFYRQAKDAGVKPIIGMEGYYTPGSRFDRVPYEFGTIVDDETSEEGSSNKGRAAYNHMTLLAYNTTGMHNLFRLSSLASLEGQYRKPRFDREILERYHEGLIATTGCPSGEVPMWLRAGKRDRAVQAAADFQDIFGKDNFYCELMDHDLAVEKSYRSGLMDIARDLQIPFVATNDLHYTHKEDAKAHGALLCIQTGDRLSNPNRFHFNGDHYYLKSAEEMRAKFRELPEACDNTLVIAERVDITFNESANYMPRYPVPEGESEESWFVKQVEKGLHDRYPNGISDEVRKRADYEVGIIAQMGFPGYFLVVADFINWAKENGIRVGPGRGSGAGSMAAYAMRITDLDPLQHGLIFERFLNPDRVSMPDFDVDFDERRRGEVINYVVDKYGSEYVAMIVTFQTIKAKNAVKDAARVLDKPYAVGDILTKAMPPDIMGKGVPLSKMWDEKHERYNEGGEFRGLYESNPEYKEVVDTAKDLEGLRRGTGVHAAGVIMSSAPLMDVIPLTKREADGAIITQFDYPTCETLGLIKMDFLGLRNLTVLDDALDNIKINRDETVVLEDLPFDDAETYRLMARGDTLGVFQLDGGPMRALLRSMRPDCFEDISAVGALYRPGPMGADSHNKYARRKTGREQVVPIHPELAEAFEDILGETYGLIVYQEQVMAIAQKVAGYTLGQADLLRRAMGKKKKAELDKQFEIFSGGMRERGYSQAAVTTLWEILLPFSDYAFNKAHSAAYGVVSYWTAYLKAHYPSEYMAALLTSVGENKDKMAVYLNECRRMGIKVLPPDVNESYARFTPVGTDIRFGMAAVRGVGGNVVDLIVKAREDKGAFTSFHDFLRKVDQQACKKNVVESLIKSGAFDSLQHPRRGLLQIHAEAIDAVADVKKQEAMGQFDLFGAMGGDEAADDATKFEVAIPQHEWPKREKLSFERDMLGLYVSDHPLHGLEHVLSSAADTSIAGLHEENAYADKDVVTVAGILTGVERKINKQGQYWAKATVEDLEGSVEIFIFARTYETVGHLVAEDQVVVVSGRVAIENDEAPKIRVADLSLPDLSKDNSGPVVLQVQALRCTPPVVSRLKQVLSGHPGMVDVHLRVLNGERTHTVRLGEALRVSRSPSLVGDVKALLGTEGFVQ
ncbi:DNA polymerase III subunit alpha [Cumulibacter manganitolerans]|uniref:DNA polymerase III subunit alpha n=1 Tax=Cumulibacter manganitolerans TaxID=1884992 RepID=UPI001E4CB25F|nr:DNA polymerase III subunit alpha [Cumulibacter manganitolerans]